MLKGGHEAFRIPSRSPSALVQSGRRVAGIGLALFVVGFFFFELVLNIGGMAGSIVVPLFLIGAGIFLLLRRARPIAAAPVAASAEPAEQVSRPIEDAPAAPAEAETVELRTAAPADAQLNAREVAAQK